MTDDIAIKVDHLSKTFKLPHEKTSSIKSAVVNFWRHNKGYEIQKALEDVSFEVKKGEFFGIVGRNGSGKSTLLKILAGIYQPSKGSVHINGKLVPFIELGVGFNNDLTGRENVFLNGALLGFNRKEMQAMYNEIVEFAELERFMDQKLKNYSSGMQVRLAFSIAIRARSDILVLDEVLAVGDAAFQKKCVNYFKQLKDSKQTVVLVTHDMSAIEKYCDRAVLVDKGEVIFMGDPYDVTPKYTALNQEAPTSHGKLSQLGNKARITKASLLDYGKRFNYSSVLEVSVKFTTEVKDTIVGISVIRSDNNYVAGFNTFSEQGIHVVNGMNTIKCRIPAKQLIQGSYFLNISLYDHDFQLLDFSSNIAEFSIRGEKDYSRDGMFKVQCEWSNE